MSELLNCPRSAGPFSSANNSHSRRLSASRTLSESGEAIGVHEAQSKTSRMGVVIMAQRNNCVLG
jgi:hypothetical protein